jgi:hypothetical protein
MPEFIIAMLICTSPDVCIPFRDTTQRFTQEQCEEVRQEITRRYPPSKFALRVECEVVEPVAKPAQTSLIF